jgi:hypothetical protein
MKNKSRSRRIAAIAGIVAGLVCPAYALEDRIVEEIANYRG